MRDSMDKAKGETFPTFMIAMAGLVLGAILGRWLLFEGDRLWPFTALGGLMSGLVFGALIGFIRWLR